MTIETDITDAIAKNLPAAVSQTLVERLTRLAKLEAENAALLKYRDEAIQLRNQAQKAELLAQREDAVKSSMQALSHREDLLKLREAHADEKVSLIRGVVTDVFANNRLKYTRNESSYDPMRGNGPTLSTSGETIG